MNVHLVGVINDPVDLRSTEPAALDVEYAFTPVQGVFADIVSADHKGG